MKYNKLESIINNYRGLEEKKSLKTELRHLKDEYNCIKYNAASMFGIYFLGKNLESNTNLEGMSMYFTLLMSAVPIILYIDNYRNYKKIENKINNLNSQ